MLNFLSALRMRRLWERAKRPLRNKVYQIIILWAALIIGGDVLAESFLTAQRHRVGEMFDWYLAAINLAVVAGGILLTIAIYFFIRRQIIQPIEEMRVVAAAFAANNRESRVRRIVDPRDDIGRLASTLNSLLDLIEEQDAVQAERLQELKVKSEELARNAHLQARFLSMVSHELRSPLNSIIGYSDLMLDGLEGELSGEQLEDVRAIRRAAEQLRALINDILDLSKLEAGHLKVEARTVPLREVIEEGRIVVAPLLEQKGVKFVLAAAEEVKVRADRNRLRQVVVNLLSNAAKFTDQGAITVRLREENGLGFLEVADSGVGIAAEHLEHIFEDFYQVEADTTRRHGGSGLGLPIVRHLLHLMAGEIRVESTVDKGTTFTCMLPLAAGEPPVVEDAVAAVMFVDADQQQLSLYGRHLARDQIGIIASRSAAEARAKLEQMAQSEPTLMRLSAMVLDLDFLGVSGYELLRWVREHPRWHDLPVGCIAAEDEDAAAFDAQLAKPVTRKGLMLLVKALLRRQ